MPLINPKDSAIVAPIPQVPVTEPKEYSGVTVDSKYIPPSKLMTYLEGSPWVVNYYSQVIDKDNPITGQSLGSNAIHQQYTLIEKLELRVTSPLTQSQDTTTKVMTLAGTASLYPGIIPNEGDMFLADVGDGREAVFQITSSDRKSIFKNTAYVIEYQLIDYATKERILDLGRKVQHKFTFVKDFYTYGKSPIVESKEYQVLRELKQHYSEISKTYFKQFFSKEFGTVIVPGQAGPTYDHFLVKMLADMFDVSEINELKFMRIYNVNDDHNLSLDCIWNIVSTLEQSMLNNIFTQTGTVSRRLFLRDPMFEGIYHTRLDYIVYPIDPVKGIDNGYYDNTKVLDGYKLIHVPSRTNLPPITPLPITGTTYDFYEDLKKDYIVARDKVSGNTSVHDVFEYSNHIKQRYYECRDVRSVVSPIPSYDYYEELKRGYVSAMDLTIGGPYPNNGHHYSYSDILDKLEDEDLIIPDIHLVTKDDYYVLSEAFYKFNNGLQGPGMSKLEVLVCRMIRQLPVNPNDLLSLCKSYHYWGGLERLYYIPLLLSLVNYVIKN